MLTLTVATAQKFCRTCVQELELVNKHGKEARYIESDDDVINWLSVIAKTAPSMWREKPQHPQRLCWVCYSKIRTVYEFHEKVIVSTETLKDLFDEGLNPSALENLHKFCRCCLSALIKDCTYIPELCELDDWMFTCIGVHMIPEDSAMKDKYPTKICNWCFGKLRNFVDFRKSVLESITYFNNIFSLPGPNNLVQESSNAETINVNKSNTKIYDSVKPVETVKTPKSRSKKNTDKRTGDKENLNLSEQNEDECLEVERAVEGNEKPATSNSKIINCERCHRKFRKQILYEAHIRRDHEGNPRPFQCHVCSSNYSLYHILRRHLAEMHNILEPKRGKEDVPSTVTKHRCDLCNRQFMRKDHLRDHIKIVHEHQRPFKCTYCEKTFGSRKVCRVHEMSHTGLKPYKCEFCEKMFRQINDLKFHRKLHTSDPNLICHICKRAKANKEELERHIEIHKARMLECSKCGKRFHRSSHLRSHEKSAHDKLRPYKCNVCQRSFALIASCRVHEKIHILHNENIRAGRKKLKTEHENQTKSDKIEP